MKVLSIIFFIFMISSFLISIINFPLIFSVYVGIVISLIFLYKKRKSKEMLNVFLISLILLPIFTWIIEYFRNYKMNIISILIFIISTILFLLFKGVEK